MEPDCNHYFSWDTSSWDGSLDGIIFHFGSSRFLLLPSFDVVVFRLVVVRAVTVDAFCDNSLADLNAISVFDQQALDNWTSGTVYYLYN